MSTPLRPKTAFVEALPTLTGLATGYGPGRSVAGETAAALAPQGRVNRSEAMARNAAVIGAPLGGLVAMGLARKHGLVPKLRGLVKNKFPHGLIAEPAIEEELVNLGVPGVAAITGSLAGGALTGGAVGGIQRARGPLGREKEASLKPSPMWGTIGGQAKTPAFRAQAGFTPPGMKTPAQRFEKSRSMGSFNRDKGLKPLDLGKMQEAVTKSAADESEKRPNARRAAGGFGLEFAGNVASMGAGALFGEGQTRESVLDPKGELRAKVKAQSSVPVHDVEGLSNGYYIPKNEGGMTMHHNLRGIKQAPRDPHILIDKSFKSPSLLSHEVGHAEIDQSRLGRLIQHPRYNKMISGSARPLAALGLGLATGGSEDERVRDAGLAGAGLLSAPNLASEGLANIKGYQRLKRLGADPAQLGAARRTLSAGMGSYLGRAAGTVGTAMLGSGIAGAVMDKRRRNAENVKMGQVMVAITKIADDGGHGGFSTNAYSGVMNPPPMVYASGIPGWKEPAVKTTKKEAGLLNTLMGAPDSYVQEVAATSGIPEDHVRPYVRNIRPQRFMVSARDFATDLKPVWDIKENKYNPLQKGLVATTAGSPEEEAYLAQHGKDLDKHYQGWVHGQANLRKKYTGGDTIGPWANIEQPHTGKLKKEASGLTPASRLASSRAIGAPRATAAPGPSIAQIAKPVGYGRPIAGAGKGNNIL